MSIYYAVNSYISSKTSREAEVLLSLLMMASAILQLGWCGYLTNAIRPRADFSRMEFDIPESELIEEEEEEECF